MKTQFDHHVRTVSLENLHAMCTRASGMSHRFEVTKVSRSRVHVTYSNPDEYGSPNPQTAIFPCYPSTFDGVENPAVIIGAPVRILNDPDDTAFQTFDASFQVPIWRDPGSGEWRTRAQIDGTDRYRCPDGKIRTVDRLHPYTDTRFGAFDVTEETPAETFARVGGKRMYAYYAWNDLRAVKGVLVGEEG